MGVTPRSLVVVASYPVIMVGAFAGFGLLLAAGVGLTPATYLMVVAAAGLVTWHEAKVPYREQWRPGRREVGADLLFMLTMQIALPYALSLAATIWLADWLRSGGIAVEGFWPHGLPAAVQVVMMLMAADFARYWLHRAFHRYDLMWRYHAVHHSPHRLYWLNVGRFHPFEKAGQYALDALPFALMGVGSEVLAGYFVFYAVNGVLPALELRRAPRAPQLPDQRPGTAPLAPLGGDRGVQQQLRQQPDHLGCAVRHPIPAVAAGGGRPRTDQPPVPRRVPGADANTLRTQVGQGPTLMPTRAGYLALRGAMAATQEPRYRRLLASAKAPDEAQARLLRSILEANTETTFGAGHRFAAIRTVADYRQAVEVQTYEDLRDHVERQELTGKPELTAEAPVYYNRTSGTSGAPKNIPLTASGLQRLKVHQRLATHIWSKPLPSCRARSSWWGVPRWKATCPEAPRTGRPPGGCARTSPAC